MLEIELRDAVGDKVDDTAAWIKEHVEWCCAGRHGVVRNLQESETNEARYAISSHYGAYDGDGLWWAHNDDGTWSCEFTHMCKVSPPPTKPWEWCGKTVLFERWRSIAETARGIKMTFPVGSFVTVLDFDDFMTSGQVDRITQKRIYVNDLAGTRYGVPLDLGVQSDGTCRYSIYPLDSSEAYEHASHGA